MDEIFGANNFVNEVIWHYHTGMRVKTHWNKKHDNILMYAKHAENITFNHTSAIYSKHVPIETLLVTMKTLTIVYLNNLNHDWFN
jgi:hypothetical protein